MKRQPPVATVDPSSAHGFLGEQGWRCGALFYGVRINPGAGTRRRRLATSANVVCAGRIGGNVEAQQWHGDCVFQALPVLASGALSANIHNPRRVASEQ